jgi:hypothetical protein
VRVVISNVFGDEPLHLGAAHVARRTTGADVDGMSDRALLFDGQTSAEVPAHGARTSEPADLEVAPFSDLASASSSPD